MENSGKAVMTAFGERLQEARIRAGYGSAQDFAAALGVEGPTYRYWERGGSQPDFANFVRICRLLNVDANFFLPSTAVDLKPEAQNDDGDLWSDHQANDLRRWAIEQAMSLASINAAAGRTVGADAILASAEAFLTFVQQGPQGSPAPRREAA